MPGTVEASAIINTTATVVPTASLGTGSATSSTYLRGDGTWATVSAEGANTLYAPGSFTVADGNFWMQVKRLALTTTQRATLAGTSRLRVMN